MKEANSVYQTANYIESLKKSNRKMICVSENMFAWEREVLIPVLGKKTILETRGNPSEEDLRLFKILSKKYFYGLIAQTAPVKKDEAYQKIGYKKTINKTIFIDLSKSEGELWNLLEKKSIRWGIKTAQKNQLMIQELSDSSDLNSFYGLYQETAKNGGFEAETKDQIKSLAFSEIAKLFLVKQKKKVIAGGLVLFDTKNNYAILDLTASSEEGLRLQAMPYLYWHMILRAKEGGFSIFDLGGYDAHAKEGDKMKNINRFKERFNGSVVDQAIFSTNLKYPLLRTCMDKMHFMRQWYFRKNVRGSVHEK